MKFRIFRYNPEKDKEPKFSEYEIKVSEGMTVLDALNKIKWKHDGTLSYRRSCRSVICGSCAVVVNGKHVLACNTQVASLKSNMIVIEPLPGFPVIKDLIVDLREFFEKYEKIKPYLITTSKLPEKEIIQSPEDFKKFEEFTTCIMCSACYSSCPSVWWRRDYLGPAALTKAYRFLADSRDEGERERLGILGRECGVFVCRTMFRCVEACPKEIDTSFAIQQIKKRLWLKLLKFL